MNATAGSTVDRHNYAATSTGILVFEDVEELDFVGPWEVFSVANRLFPGSFPMRLLSTGRPGVRARYGLSVEKIDSIYETPPPQLLVLPGGPGRRVMMRDTQLLGYLRQLHQEGTLLASVCTGAFLLAAAGLLDGKSATTHGSALEELRRYPNVSVVPQRFVDAGDIVTAAGISAGIDMSLHLVARFLDRAAAQEVARTMEYSTPTSPT